MRRRWFSARALLLHLALVIAVPGCFVAAWWQVTVAMAGNPLGWLYAVEWPLFAVLSAITWWQLIHEDKNNPATRVASLIRLPDEMGLRSSEADGPIVEPERPFKTHSGSIGGDEDSSRQWHSTNDPAVVTGVLETASPSLIRALLTAKWEQEDEELASYNSYLAALSASGKAKTWTNPNGEPIEESVR